MNFFQLKNLNRKAVKKVALKIIKEKGLVTTLEIKLALRHKGYFAQQQQVSNYMDKLAYDHQ